MKDEVLKQRRIDLVPAQGKNIKYIYIDRIRHEIVRKRGGVGMQAQTQGHLKVIPAGSPQNRKTIDGKENQPNYIEPLQASLTKQSAKMLN